jgi:tetratricopeptide (TPR) repeat protein
MNKKSLNYFILIICYVFLFSLQLNQHPFERFPNWDYFWGDVLQSGKLIALKHALAKFELPSVNPYVNFGWNNLGDPSSPMSFLSPLNLLIFLFPPDIVIMVRTAIFLILGGIGAYLYLNSLTRDNFLSFFGGLTYISIPIVISMYYYSPLMGPFYMIPFFFLLIHKILEKITIKKILLFVALSIFAIASGDIFVLILLPAVVGGYSFFVACGYYRFGFLNSFKKASALMFLCILSGSFYILPLYNNLRTISSALSTMQEAGLYGGSAAKGVQDFLEFFYKYGIQTLYKPNEGSGLLLYVPAFFYVVIITSLLFNRLVFKENRRQVVITSTLVGLGLLMFFISLLFYSLPPSISQLGRGTLRYHINLIPFVNVLAAFVCFGAINRLKDFKKEIYGLIIIGSFLVDLLLFSVPYPASADLSWFDVRHSVGKVLGHSSNRMSVRFLKDMWLFLPWLNIMFVILLFSRSLIKKFSYTHIKRTLYVAFIVCAMALALLNISVHNELRATQQSGWQEMGRSPYHWHSYLKRKECIDGIIERHDLNYRTLPVSGDVFQMGRGRNWKLIAETELNVQDREKVLFSYRETIHPYTSLLYSTFSQGFAPSNWFPPLSASVPGNIEIIRLMGVRWVISADESIGSPDLIYRGKCISEEPPFHETAAGGTVYIYELRKPIGIAFLVDDYQVVNLLKSLKTVFQNKEYPWSRSVVYLERTPTDVGAPRACLSGNISSNLENKAAIVRENFNSIEIDVSTSTEKYLVLSYLYRPNWKAYLGSHELNIYRAYGGFMAVEVPPGNHIIKFRYSPMDVYWGLFLTTFAFLIPLTTYLGRRFWEPARRWLVALASNCRARLITLVVILCVGTVGLYIWFGPLAQTRLLNLANALYEAGHYRQAADHYRQVLNNGTGGLDVTRRLGQCYEAREQWPEAAKLYEKWTKVAPEDADAWIKLGWAYYHTENHELAISKFARALELDEGRLEGYKGQGLCYYALGSYRKALWPLKKWAQLEPENFEAKRWVGIVSYMEGNDIESAIEHLNEAIEMADNVNKEELAQIYYALGEAYCQIGKVGACNAAFRKAEALDPTGELLSGENQKSRDEANVEIAMKNLIMGIDFSKILSEGGSTFAVAWNAQKAVKIEGSVHVVDGPWEGSMALMVGGQANYTRIYGPPSTINLKEGSFAMWARLADPKKRYSDLVACYSKDTPRIIYIYHQGVDGRFIVGYNHSPQVGTSLISVTDDKWHHYAFTWKDGEQKFYIDGREVITGAAPASTVEIVTFAIGWLGVDDSEQWHGPFAEFTTFGRALNAREVMAMYRLGSLASR